MRPCRQCGNAITNAEVRCHQCGTAVDGGPKVTPADSSPPISNLPPVSAAKDLFLFFTFLIGLDPIVIFLVFLVIGTGCFGYAFGHDFGMAICVALVSLGIIIWAAIRELRKPKRPPL